MVWTEQVCFVAALALELERRGEAIERLGERIRQSRAVRTCSTQQRDQSETESERTISTDAILSKGRYC